VATSFAAVGHAYGEHCSTFRSDAHPERNELHSQAANGVAVSLSPEPAAPPSVAPFSRRVPHQIPLAAQPAPPSPPE